MPSISIMREAASADSNGFFDAVANGSAENGDYPYIYTVEIDGTEYYGFDSDLPSSREPWMVGFKQITRDTVLEAETLEEADAEMAEAVNAIISRFADDVSSSETDVDLLSLDGDGTVSLFG